MMLLCVVSVVFLSMRCMFGIVVVDVVCALFCIVVNYLLRLIDVVVVVVAVWYDVVVLCSSYVCCCVVGVSVFLLSVLGVGCVGIVLRLYCLVVIVCPSMLLFPLPPSL